MRNTNGRRMWTVRDDDHWMRRFVYFLLSRLLSVRERGVCEKISVVQNYYSKLISNFHYRSDE